jgi:hypothetical protein
MRSCSLVVAKTFLRVLTVSAVSLARVELTVVEQKPIVVFPPIHWVKMKEKESKKRKASQNGKRPVPTAKNILLLQ